MIPPCTDSAGLAFNGAHSGIWSGRHAAACSGPDQNTPTLRASISNNNWFPALPWPAAIILGCHYPRLPLSSAATIPSCRYPWPLQGKTRYTSALMYCSCFYMRIDCCLLALAGSTLGKAIAPRFCDAHVSSRQLCATAGYATKKVNPKGHLQAFQYLAAFS